MADKPFVLPDLRGRQQAAARMDDDFRRDLNVLMTAWRETNVSKVIKWAVAQQAGPIRAKWQEDMNREAKKESDG